MDIKFYFCESCGKRLTNIDLEAGQAKDKKLKGVYCKSCSVGVSTMDLAPLTDEEARVLEHSLAPAVEVVNPPRKIQPRIAERHSAAPDPKAPLKPKTMLVVAASSVVVLIAVIVIAIGKSRHAPEQTLAAVKQPAPVVAPAPTPTPLSNPAPIVAAPEAPKTQGPAPAVPTAGVEQPAGIAPASVPAPVPTPVATPAVEVPTPPPVPTVSAVTTATEPPVADDVSVSNPPPLPGTNQACTVTTPPATIETAPEKPRPSAPLNNVARIRQALCGELLKSTEDLYVEAHYDFQKNPKAVSDFEGPCSAQSDGMHVRALAHFDKEFGNSEVLRHAAVFQPRALRVELVVTNARHDIEIGRIGNAHLKARWIDAGSVLMYYGPRFAGDIFKGKKWKHPAEGGTYRLTFERVPGAIRFLVDDKEMASEALPREALLEKDWITTFVSNNEFVVKEALIKGYLDPAWLKEKTTPPVPLAPLPIPADVVPAPGLFGCYYKGADLKDADFVVSRIDNEIKFDCQNREPAPGVPASAHGIRWSGFLKIDKAAHYTFSAYMNDGGRLWLDNKLLIDKWIKCNDGIRPTHPTADVELPAGMHTLRLDYVSHTWNTVILYWSVKDSFAETVIPPEALYHDPRLTPGTKLPDTPKR